MSRLETTGSTNKPTQVPKTTRKRSTSLVVVKCDIASGFSAKTTKTVQKHQREAHEMKPHNETTFNQSVSDSILDATVDVSANGQTDGLEHKTSTDFYQEVSCKQQSTVMRKLQEDPLNVSRSLLETSLVKPEDLDVKKGTVCCVDLNPILPLNRFTTIQKGRGNVKRRKKKRRRKR